MPFTFQWDNVSPADPTAANLLGKDIRDLRSAIQERMDSVFCDPSGSWLNSGPAVPLVPLPAISAKVTGKHITIPHTAFVSQPYVTSGAPFGGSSTATMAYTDLYASLVWSAAIGAGARGGDAVYASVIVPIGCTMTGFSVFADPRTTTAIVATLQDNVVYGTAAGYAASVLGTATTPAASGLVLANSAAFSVSSTLSSVLYIKVTLPTAAFGTESGRIYGCQITYNSIDSTTVY